MFSAREPWCFDYTRENNKIGAKSTFSSQETLGYNRLKEAMGSENDGKANMCPCAVKEAGVKTDWRLNFRTLYNLFDITLCMHWIRCVVWATSKMRRCIDVLLESIFSCGLSVWRTRRKRILYVPEPSNLNWMGNHLLCCRPCSCSSILCK